MGCGRDTENKCALKHFNDNSTHFITVNFSSGVIWYEYCQILLVSLNTKKVLWM